jgi:hypothetical protein
MLHDVSLIEIGVRFKGAYCLHQQDDYLMMEAVISSETSVNFYETTGTTSHKQSSSYSPQWETNINLGTCFNFIKIMLLD